MNYTEALDTARVRHKTGKGTKISHPLLPFPIHVDRDGNIKIGFFSLNMNVEQFTLSREWRVAE